MTEAKTVTVTPREVYGKTLFYPANPEAEQLAKIAGTKTLSREALTGAAILGCNVRIDLTPLLGPDQWSPEVADLIKEIGG